MTTSRHQQSSSSSSSSSNNKKSNAASLLLHEPLISLLLNKCSPTTAGPPKLPSSLSSPSNNKPALSSSSQSHLVLYQHHSIGSTPKKRMLAASPQNNASLSTKRQQRLYRMANVYEPRIAAQRDACGVSILQLMFRQLLLIPNSTNTTNKGPVSSPQKSPTRHNLSSSDSKAASTDVSTSKIVILVQTLGSSIRYDRNDVDDHHPLYVIDAWSDPLGWSDDEDDEDNMDAGDEIHHNAEASMNGPAATEAHHRTIKVPLNNLDKLLQTIQTILSDNNDARDRMINSDTAAAGLTNTTAVLFFESLNPMLHCHGISKTCAFLHYLKHKLHDNCCSPIVLPIVADDEIPYNMRQIEDMSNVVLTLTKGTFTIVRKSLSISGGKITKCVQDFTVDDTDGTFVGLCGGSNNSNVKQESNDKKKESSISEPKQLPVPVPIPPSDNTLGSNVRAQQSNNSKRGGINVRNGKGKVVLSHESDDTKRNGIHRKPVIAVSRKTIVPTPAPAPRIFLQDDDPEFDDLDEEDPDDDLDI